MGRYYEGDIEGKFWFGVQYSYAADRFGVTGSEPDYLVYYFDEDDLQDVEDELQRIEDTIGIENIKALDDFFNSHNGYSNTMLEEAELLDIYNKHISDYADRRLGIKIRNSIRDTGRCKFTAEL